MAFEQTLIDSSLNTGAPSTELLQLLQFKAQLLAALPFKAFEVVAVTFPAAANTDIDVRHTLTPSQPDTTIHYLPLRADRACRIYHDQTGTRVPWASNIIRLRCDTASAVVTLLLVTIPAA